MPFQPGDRLGVEVVGRLVQQQDVGLGQQQPAERHAAPLAAGEDGDGRVAGRTAQCVHRLLQPAVQRPGVVLVDLLLHPRLLIQERLHVIGIDCAEPLVDLVILPQQIYDGLHRLLDDLAHGLAGVELRLLRQEAARVALGEHRLAQVILVHARHDAQEGALARAVQTEHADLSAVEKAERDVAQHLTVGRVDAPDAHH